VTFVAIEVWQLYVVSAKWTEASERVQRNGYQTLFSPSSLILKEGLKSLKAEHVGAIMTENEPFFESLEVAAAFGNTRLGQRTEL